MHLLLLLALAQAPAAVLSAIPPGQHVAYGPAPSQYVEVFTPAGPGPYPVAVFVHGGCYLKSSGGVAETRDTYHDLVQRGVAVWAVEYRRADEPGGGYPGMYQDIAAALDLLPATARRLRLDASRTVLVGHSAGAHLVLWAAERSNLPGSSAARTATSARFSHVFAIAPPGDLALLKPRVEALCGPGVFDKVVGAATPARPDPLGDTSPAALLPLNVPTTLIGGSADDVVPLAHVAAFEQKARAAGSKVTLEVRPGAGHIDLIIPGNPGWARTAEAIAKALGK